jgi:hypothetical protein
MKIVILAVVCCLLSMFATLSFQAVSPKDRAKCKVSNLKAEYTSAKAVFVGKVLSESKDGDVKTFVFEVERRWKGAPYKKIEISVQETMRYQAWFEVGEKYLVYARADAENKKLRETRCSRTKRLADASADISQLGEAQKPVEK